MKAVDKDVTNSSSKKLKSGEHHKIIFMYTN